MVPTDRELLRALAARPAAVTLQPLLERYLPFVYASAVRQLAASDEATDVTRAVFAALIRRARPWPRRRVLADWLFSVTRLAVRNVKRARNGTTSLTGPALDSIDRAAFVLDQALSRLPTKLRSAVLVSHLLGWTSAEAAAVLRVSPRRVQKRAAKGFAKLQRRVRRLAKLAETDTPQVVIAAMARAPAVPDTTAADILTSFEAANWKTANLPLVASMLRGLAWSRWKRLLKVAGATVGVLGLVAGLTVLSAILLWRSGQLLPWLIQLGAWHQLKSIPELAQPAQPWGGGVGEVDHPPGEPAALYRLSQVWRAELACTETQWAGITPRRVPPVRDIMQPDGTLVLRNPKASRSGVAGALGFDFDWTPGALSFSGRLFTNVALRIRGNGTYLSSLYGVKQSFKVDLDKFQSTQRFAGIRTLNFLNLIEDRSYMHDALGYELFRDAGVPAPRTTYVWLTLTVSGRWERKPLGLYLLVENVDGEFAADRFGDRTTPIFKPVTPDLFKYLGEDWAAYADIYDLKTKATPVQKARVIQFAHLLTNGTDAEFAQRAREFLDLDGCARYVAALVLVNNLDSLLTFGQNYYLYLDPRTARFGFIPWDLDQAWGSFPAFGTAAAREHASIWHPWAGRNRFLERLFGLDEFRDCYRHHLEELLATVFVPDRLCAKVDLIAPVIRGAIAAESGYRLRLFDQAVSAVWLSGPRDGGDGPGRPVHQLKRFIANRARSVRLQLDGRSRGIPLERSDLWQQ